MKKKLSKVLAVVLSLVMVVGLATVDASTAQAAKKLQVVSSGKKAVKSGQKRTIKIKGPNAKKAKWSVSGTGKAYVSLNKKKGKTVKMTVKENATGKVTVTAKLTKKNKVSVKYNLSCVATAIALEGGDVFTNETKTLALTVTPSNAKLAGDVVYGVFSDEAAATITTDATVTAGAMGCDFAAAKEGTYYVKATCGEMSSIAKVTAADKVAKLVDVKQTKKNVLAVTFDVDMEQDKMDSRDFKIANNAGVSIDVEKIDIDKDDKKLAYVTTLVKMADGKENTISYKDGEAVAFMASDGKISSIDVPVDTVPVNTAVKIEAVVLDKDNVELDRFKFGSEDTTQYEFTIDAGADGAADTTTGTLTMDKEAIGKTAKVTVIWHSGEFDETSGDENVVKCEKTITAVAEGNVVGAKSVKFYKRNPDDAPNTDEDATYSYLMENEKDNMKENPRVDTANGNVYDLKVIVEDENGYEKVNGSLKKAGYTLETSNDKIMLVNGDEIVGVKEGRASILVKDEKGETKFTIPVEMEAESVLTTFNIKKTTMNLTAADTGLPKGQWQADTGDRQPHWGSGWTPDSDSFVLEVKDQYGDDYTNATVEITGTNQNNRPIVKMDGKGKTTTVSSISAKFTAEECFIGNPVKDNPDDTHIRP